MQLNDTNYYSTEADKEYMSCSQYKRWMECEAAAFEHYVIGNPIYTSSDAMLIGSYAHSLNDGTDEEFIADHPEIIGKSGEYKGRPKREYDVVLRSYLRAMQDDYFRLALDGEKEVIYTANWCGIEWKCKVDVINHEHLFISDLKTVSDFSLQWMEIDGRNVKVPFYEAWKYWLQFALYQKIVELSTGKLYDIYCPAITKQDPPDYDVYDFNQYPVRIENELDEFERNIERIMLVKADAIERIRCGKCEYCRKTKKIEKITIAESYQ